jgi:hypothetical protein
MVTAVLFLTGCDTTTTSTLSQQVYEIAWLPDESGMLAFINKSTYNSIDGSTTNAANLYHAGSDGSLGNSINGSDVTITWTSYAPIVFIASNGQTAITQFGNDIFSIALSSGNVTDVIRNTALLGVSPDMKYAETSTLAGGLAANILTNYNLTTGTPAPIFPRKTIPGLISNRVLWLNNGRFAATIFDSLGPDQEPYSHVTVYDATTANCDSVMGFPNGDVSFHASAFSSGSGDLFVRTHNLGIDRINLNTLVRTSIITNDSVESMDASSNGSLLVYTSADSATRNNLYAINVANGHSALVASSIVAPILSPMADRVGTIHLIDGSNSDIHVYPAVLPP